MRNALLILSLVSIMVGCSVDHDHIVHDQAPPVPVITVTPPLAGLACKVYDLTTVQPSVLPSFTATPSQALLGTVWAGAPVASYNLTEAINFGDAASMLAGSGVTQTTWFALDCVGNVDVGVAALYTLKLNSDDGSVLYVDGYKFINNDGMHGATLKTASMLLSQGSHHVELQFFEGNGPALLQLFSNIAVEFTHE